MNRDKLFSMTKDFNNTANLLLLDFGSIRRGGRNDRAGVIFISKQHTPFVPLSRGEKKGCVGLLFYIIINPFFYFFNNIFAVIKNIFIFKS